MVGNSRSHKHERQADGGGQDPVTHVDNLCIAWRAEVQRPDGVAHGDVAVHAHHGQGEDAGEHVVVVDGDDHLAQELPERPGVHQVLGALEGQRARGQSICQSQVEDVDVGGGLHLSVSS